MCASNTGTEECFSEDEKLLPHELHRKLVAEAFWNAECELEIRESEDTYYFKSASSREEFMENVDKKRTTTLYPHTDCSEECKKRGELT